MSFEFLQSENSIGLRYYQFNAIKAVEKSIIYGKKAAVITMATGDCVIIVIGCKDVDKLRFSGIFTNYKILCIV